MAKDVLKRDLNQHVVNLKRKNLCRVRLLVTVMDDISTSALKDGNADE